MRHRKVYSPVQSIVTSPRSASTNQASLKSLLYAFRKACHFFTINNRAKLFTFDNNCTENYSKNSHNRNINDLNSCITDI